MREILRIFCDDTKRLLKNPVAIIVTIGLVVIPSLYAWFNIVANWDPYGNTGNLDIAVANMDQGVTIADALADFEDLPNADKLALDPDKTIMCIGDEFVNNLRENDQINWIFVEQEEALAGVERGEYYAAIVVPENFSKDFFSFLSDDIVHPTLQYHVNAKKNAIATKITDTVVSNIKTQVNESFVNTVTEIFGITVNDLAVELDEVKDATLGDNLTNLRLLDEALVNMEDTLTIIDSSFKSTGIVLENTLENIPYLKEDLEKLKTDSVDAANLGAAGKNLAHITELTLESIMANTDDLAEVIKKQLDITLNLAQEADQADLLDGVTTITEKNIALLEKAETFVNDFFIIDGKIKQGLLERIANVKDREQRVIDDINDLESDLKGYGRFSEKNMQKIENSLQEMDAACNEMHEYYQNKIAPVLADNLDNLINTAVDTPQAAERLQNMLTNLSGALNGLDALLSNQEQNYDSIKRLLEHSRAQVQDCIAILERGEQLGEENYLYNLMTNDPQKLASFVSSPTNIETITMYPIANYGSAMAPFYTVLSLWVGALILAAILNVNITNPAFKGFRLYQQYFGRSITFSILGVLQALVVSLGDLYILHIQCLSPWKFVLVCVVCGYTFNKIVYTLTIAFDDVGKAIAVILLVLQVAGSGGTFPSEVMPEFFSAVNSVLPFNFALTATRECIAGFYGNVYWHNVFLEFLYVPPCIIIGLLTWKKVYKAKNYFRRKMEETGIM